MECITLANELIELNSTNMMIGLILFTLMGVCLGVIFDKALNREMR